LRKCGEIIFTKAAFFSTKDSKKGTKDTELDVDIVFLCQV
jgi:hypothetical protein